MALELRCFLMMRGDQRMKNKLQVFIFVFVVCSCGPSSGQERAGDSVAPLDFVTGQTCSDSGMPANCVEVHPGQNGPGYEYDSTHGVYFFRNLSNEDHFFLLMGDIDCEKTCTVFGLEDGNPDVESTTTFDLNGYTMRYSAANYESIPNNSFESWTGNTPDGWTVVSGSVVPRDTAYWQPMSGDSVLYAENAVTLESSLISLPEARAYRGYMTVGRAARSSGDFISMEVLDESGNVMCSERKSRAEDGETPFFRGQSLACRFDSTGSGNYRLRIQTSDYAYIDRTGIVPIGDYGVAVLTSWSLSDSNSNQDPIVQNLSGLSIPPSGDYSGPDRYNHLEVRNGRIEAAHENQISYGIRTLGTTRGQFHNLEIVANGLKSHSISSAGEIHHNNLIVNMPWYFSRENSDEENVILGGGEFHHNNAIGGQGVIRLRGTNTKVYNNYIRNNAQATNHYAIIHSGAENPEIYDNIFDPIEGSGILTYVGHGYKIHGNVFYVRTATCNVEYINEDYSTNAIRMNDYGAETNYDNWVYDNSFYIEGHSYDTNWENCMPIATGIFYSASGVNNRIFNNYFQVIKDNNNDQAPTFALYLGGATNNATDNLLFHNNVIETNDKAAWIASPYGHADYMWFENNYFVRLANSFYTPNHPESALRLGYYSGDVPGLMLVNNHFVDGFDSDDYYFTANNSEATYDLTKQWYLRGLIKNASGGPAVNATVRAVSSAGTVEGVTDASGEVTLRLTEYSESGDLRSSGTHDRESGNPYSISVIYGGDTINAGSLSITGETLLEASFQHNSSEFSDVETVVPDVGADNPQGPGFGFSDDLVNDGDSGPSGTTTQSGSETGGATVSGGCQANGNSSALGLIVLLMTLVFRRRSIRSGR